MMRHTIQEKWQMQKWWFIKHILESASSQWEKDGFLEPTLYLFCTQDGVTRLPLDLPDDAEERAHVFVSIGRQLCHREYVPEEILLVAKSWFFIRRPSAHGMRGWLQSPLHLQEFILLVGHNADKSRTTYVISPYTAGRSDLLIVPPSSLAVYDALSASAKALNGLVDYLFEVTST